MSEAIHNRIERRVLASLPTWHENEEWLIAEEGGPLRVEDGVEVGSRRAYSLPELTARLREDVTIVVDFERRSLTEDEVGRTLAALAAQGYCVNAEGWRMTQAGFEALHVPLEQGDSVPGPVEVELAPAVVDSQASAG